MNFSFKTDVGIYRKINEDSCSFGETNGGHFCIAIADGVGGSLCGEIASKIATQESTHYLNEIIDLSNENAANHLLDAVKHANEKIILLEKSDPKYKGMGTTIVLALIIDKTAHILHVGDSRAYLAKKENLVQITYDHSYIEELVKIGVINRDDAKNHPKKNVITRALGSVEGSTPDITTIELAKDDLLLLCTDGLTNMLSKDEFESVTLKIRTPNRLCERLVKLALKAGGKDNITVAVFKM
ncbi:MAG: Stp1/IreP family PP2C-type Ser/Thr phosphatase [Bacillota bacterium]